MPTSFGIPTCAIGRLRSCEGVARSVSSLYRCDRPRSDSTAGGRERPSGVMSRKSSCCSPRATSTRRIWRMFPPRDLSEKRRLLAACVSGRELARQITVGMLGRIRPRDCRGRGKAIDAGHRRDFHAGDVGNDRVNILFASVCHGRFPATEFTFLRLGMPAT